MGAHVAGCSVDTVEDQRAFAEKSDLSYPLIADPEGEISRAYGAYKDDWKLAGRVTAVIGEDGSILRIYPDAPLNGAGHAEAVYRDVREFVEGAS